MKKSRFVERWIALDIPKTLGKVLMELGESQRQFWEKYP